jgi:hypothetical protein
MRRFLRNVFTKEHKSKPTPTTASAARRQSDLQMANAARNIYGEEPSEVLGLWPP